MKFETEWEDLVKLIHQDENTLAAIMNHTTGRDNGLQGITAYDTVEECESMIIDRTPYNNGDGAIMVNCVSIESTGDWEVYPACLDQLDIDWEINFPKGEDEGEQEPPNPIASQTDAEAFINAVESAKYSIIVGKIREILAERDKDIVMAEMPEEIAERLKVLGKVPVGMWIKARTDKIPSMSVDVQRTSNTWWSTQLGDLYLTSTLSASITHIGVIKDTEGNPQ